MGVGWREGWPMNVAQDQLRVIMDQVVSVDLDATQEKWKNGVIAVSFSPILMDVGRSISKYL